MGDHRSLQRDGERMDGLRGWVFGITGDWSTAALDPGVWYSIA